MNPFDENGNDAASSSGAEKDHLVKFARIFFYLHLALIPIIVFLGDWIISISDRVGSFLFDMSKISTGDNDFWKVPLIGILFALALCSRRVWRDAGKIDWLQPILAVHGITAVSFLVYYFVDVGSLAYLLAMIFELILFAAALFFWWTYKDSSGTPD